MHFDAKKLDLYIFDEYSNLRTRNETIFEELYDTLKKVSRDELVIADSAEQKSIADFKAYGAFIRPAEKGPDSVRYGIKWLQGLRHIYIDKRRCPLTYREFVGYEYGQDRDGNFISSYPDVDNHCLVGETLVDTVNGPSRIEDLVGTNGQIYCYDLETNEKVISDYCNCRMTFEEADIWEVELEDGRVIECTYDHPILTSNRGYVKASELTSDDDVVCITKSLVSVKEVRKTKTRKPVYDLEVPKYHNFSINNGIIVHNSIDAVRYALSPFWKKRGN